MPAAKKKSTRPLKAPKSATKAGAGKPSVKKLSVKKTTVKKPTVTKKAVKKPAKAKPALAAKPTKKSAPAKTRKAASQKTRRAAGVVHKVMKTVKGSAPKSSDLFAELEGLAKYIQDAKREIAALSPDEVKDDFLPTASGELDAIIEATAVATNLIMDSTEEIEEVMSGLEGENAARLMNATTNIYEACGFQDITGQRITKVVSTLQEIEDKVDGLVAVFTDGSAGAAKIKKKKAAAKASAQITDEDLLNGPQANDKAKSQAEIDALLASFD